MVSENVGLELELRAEGAVAIDPDDVLSESTSRTGSVSDLALLLLAE